MRTNTLLVSILLILFAFRAPSDIYGINVQTIDGSSVSLNSYNGKKIVVIEFDAGDYNESQLRMLDTLNRIDSNITVIAVPAKDFNEAVTTQIVQNLIVNLNLSFIVAQPSFVKKAADSNQQHLFKWLTHSDENNHFDNEVDQPGKIYLVSGTGILYAVIENGTNNSLVKELINQQIN